MNDVPCVSVIIPCYNQGNYIKETLDSVIAQTFRNWEAIVVDDGSTDESGSIVRGYQKKDARIHYVYQKNAGVSSARNTGVEQAEGKYILPLDSDDIIAPELLERAVDYLECHAECMLYYCHAAYTGESNEAWDTSYKDYPSLLLGNTIFCSSVFRKKDFERIGGYDQSFVHGYEDWEFYIRLLADGGAVFQDPAVLFYYRLHNKEQESRSVEALRREQEIMTMIYNKNESLYHRYYPPYIQCVRNLQTVTQHRDALMSETEKQQKRIDLYFSNPVLKIIYKLIRGYRKHIKKDSLY